MPDIASLLVLATIASAALALLVLVIWLHR